MFSRFTDLGSCAGGINRRDTAVVFTLEKEGALLGRRVLPVRSDRYGDT